MDKRSQHIAMLFKIGWDIIGLAFATDTTEIYIEECIRKVLREE